MLLHVLFLWSGLSFLLYNLITENAHSSLKALLNVLCLGKFPPSLLGEDESLPLWVLPQLEDAIDCEMHHRFHNSFGGKRNRAVSVHTIYISELCRCF